MVEESIKENLARIYLKLDRPSWLVVALISGLMTSTGALVMWIITHAAK